MSRSVIRINDEMLAIVKEVADEKGIELGEAADLLIKIGNSRRSALSKYAKKTTKPKKEKAPKASKPKKERAAKPKKVKAPKKRGRKGRSGPLAVAVEPVEKLDRESVPPPPSELDDDFGETFEEEDNELS